MSAYTDAVLALHGATGANGETLAVLRHFAASATDLSASATNGSLVGSPTTTTGPLMPEASGGSALTFNGTSQYLDGGSAADCVTAINNNGLTVIAWCKHSNTADKDLIFGFRRGGTEGLYFGLNLLSNGNYDTTGGGCSALLSNSGFSPYVGATWGFDTDSRHLINTWNQYGLYVKPTLGSPAANVSLEFMFNAVPQVSHSASSAAGNFAALSATGTKFAFGGSFDTAAIDTGAYFNGSMGYMTVIHGKLTQAQWNTLYLAACYSVSGIPVRHAHYDMASSCFADAVDGTPCADGDEIVALKDLSGNANHLAVAAGATGPTYLDVNNWGMSCADFNNLLFNASGEMNAMVKTDATSMLPAHCCVIIVGRVQVTTKYGKPFSQLGGIYHNDTPGTPRAVVALQSQDAGTNGDDKIVFLSGSTGRYYNGAHVNYPTCRTMPGLAIMAINVGGDGVCSTLPTPVTYMNRWSGTTNGAIAAGTTSTGIRLGGAAADGTSDMAMFRAQEVIITNALPASTIGATLLAFMLARFSANNETLYPTKHICLAGDSVFQGEVSTYNRNAFAYFPTSAKRTTSFSNASVQNAHIKVSGGGTTLNMDERGLDTANKWNDPSARRNILFFPAGENDTSGGDTGANMATDALAIGAACKASGAFSKVVVFGVSPSISTSPACTDYNTLMQAASGGAVVDVYIPAVTLTAGEKANSTHPNDAGHYKFYQAVWNTWGAQELGSSGGGAMGGGSLVGFGGL